MRSCVTFPTGIHKISNLARLPYLDLGNRLIVRLWTVLTPFLGSLRFSVDEHCQTLHIHAAIRRLPL